MVLSSVVASFCIKSFSLLAAASRRLSALATAFCSLSIWRLVATPLLNCANASANPVSVLPLVEESTFLRAIRVEPPTWQLCHGNSDAFRSAVREEGLEPSHPCGHRHLKPARLPIPPLALTGTAKVSSPSCCFRTLRLPTTHRVWRPPAPE